MFFAAPSLSELITIFNNAHKLYRTDHPLMTTDIRFDTSKYTYYSVKNNEVIQITDFSMLKEFKEMPIFVLREKLIYVYKIKDLRYDEDKPLIRVYLNPIRDVFNKYISKYHLGLIMGHIKAGMK